MRALALIGPALAALLTSAAFGADIAPDIAPGSPAPALSVKTWLKGTPITEFEKDKTYVVEFWATWCGPCIQTIPHVTKLAKENKDVTFLGIGIWEDEKGDNLKSFVAKMGDKMDYNVGYSGNKDGMAETWMEAAGQNGIPTAFIVKGGQIMWVGHPMGLDAPLAEIKAGTFDLSAFKTTFATSAEKNRKQMAANKAFKASSEAFKAGKRAEAKASLAKLVAENPEAAAQAESMRFDWLATEDPQAWETQAKKMAMGKKPDEIQALSRFALGRSQTPEGAPLARKAITLALGANPDDFFTLLYAASVYTLTEDHKLALNATDKLIKLFPESQFKDNAEMKESFIKQKAELEAKIAKG